MSNDKPVVSKKIFIAALDEMEAINQFYSDYNDFLISHDVSPYVEFPTCENAAIMILTDLFNDEDGVLVSFCYDTNFGREKPVVLNNGKREIKDVGELYDYLTEKLEQH